MQTVTPATRLDKQVLSDLDRAISLEWILANGLGGYASSTVLGINTRKYHGLLVPSFNPPTDRRVVLSKLDIQLATEGTVHSLSSNEFSQGLHPQGYRLLESFAQSPFPTYTYRADDVRLRKTILVPHLMNAAVIFYETMSSLNRKTILQISPLVNSRHFHAVTQRARLGWTFVQRPFSRKAVIQIADPQSALIVSSSAGEYIQGEKWVENLLYRVDRSLGTSCYDDCYVPGMFSVDLTECPQFHIVAAAGKSLDEAELIFDSVSARLTNRNEFCRGESKRLIALWNGFHHLHSAVPEVDWLKWLVMASDAFIVDRLSTKTKSVIAGYHWFEDWGRDSLISLPGLTLVTGRHDAAKEILLTFMQYCRNGIVPNRFADAAGEPPLYNTVDATLWFFHAVLQYLKYTSDWDFVKQRLWCILQSVINYHIQGTINNIHLDTDGLIAHGPQLTWMDAMVHNNPVTPREGKTVEVQALWYNALKVTELLARRFGQEGLAEEYRSRAGKAKKSFVEQFWSNSSGGLFDVVNDGAKDPSLRPNQIFAASLDFSMLDDAQQSSVVSVVHDRLWTRYGLRTLSSDDPRYRGRYAGDWAERDFAYHNGTVWPWLTGPFVTAFLKVKRFEAKWRQAAFNSFLQPLFEEQLVNGGIGTLGEVFDGDPPHAPGGCIAQAWSVAEPLRAYAEDVLFDRPPFERGIFEGLRVSEDK
jgi:predicted glycogen debranching enzyme